MVVEHGCSTTMSANGLPMLLEKRNLDLAVTDSDRLHLKMPATQNRSHADELAGGEVFGEIAFINGVEFVVVR